MGKGNGRRTARREAAYLSTQGGIFDREGAHRRRRQKEKEGHTT